jgi:ABC-2 type transport system permease protein/oleandomycin transport system permease protein
MRESILSSTDDITPEARPAAYWTVSDTWILARRQLLRIPRIPDELITSALQPILMVLMFRFVFAGAINVPGTSYINYLMAGIFVISLILGSAFSGIGLATDLQRGLIDRFRSLPMAQSAVLTGRTLADLLRTTFIVLLTWGVGLLVGFRPQGGILNWTLAVGLLVLASFMFSWFNVLLGLLLHSVEAVQQSVVIWGLPLMFVSSALVPTATMPSWLQPFAEHQPVSVIVTAVRGLVLDQPDAIYIEQSLAWCLGLLIVFISLSVWAYGRRASRS